jgi:uncharacterized protein YqjF (DUF2071 family)
MSPDPAAFLTTKWYQLAMLNYEVDPKVLQPFVPAGTELDDWRGQTFASVVGFLFLDTRVLGVPIPYHRNFEEVNLRFYVRRKASEGWRRAVVFIKEIVPRIAIAWVARALYGENYVALPMRHSIGLENETGPGPRTVSYSWWFRGRENRMEVTVSGNPEEVAEGSAEEFIAEHYWGHARRRDGRTTEYRVEHSRWRVLEARAARLECDVAGLYGRQFVEFLQSPASAFLAEGSEVTVFKGTLLPT